MKYAVEIGSSARLYIPAFIKNVSGIQKSIPAGEGVYRHKYNKRML
jgi:hypothetical protein